MTPPERLQAAIEKLETLKAQSTPGPWLVDNEEPAIWTAGETVAGGTVFYVNTDQQTGDHRPHGDADLLVTLHRIIAAQLAILHEAVFQLSGAEQARGFIGNELSLFLTLADAILGEAS